MSRKRQIYDTLDGKVNIASPALLLTSNLPDPIMANAFIADLVMSVSAKLYEDYISQQKELSVYNITANA